jgi:poly(3-hydroxybutyrate) depolymerase
MSLAFLASPAVRALAASWLALSATYGLAAPAAPLPVLHILPGQTTVSGLSSGGYMAVQLHVAYSATFAKGAGIVAGGPYDCARGSLLLAIGPCTLHTLPIPVATLVATAKAWAASGAIDPVANLAHSRVYLYSGTRDDVVVQPVMDDLQAWYRSFVPAADIVYKKDLASGHAMITDDYGSACKSSASPYIDNCGFDLAGQLLQHLYGALAPRNDGALSGKSIEFDQATYAHGHGMAATGWLYVPAACAAGDACRLHVAIHGCEQNTAFVGQRYVRRAGYDRWADTNHLVVLYPQTGDGSTDGCWDWWGYDSADYAKKSGPQMAAVKAMVDRLSGIAPTAGAATCTTASNYAHTVAGRATALFGLTYAHGSRQDMGPWNIFVTTTLKQVGPDDYVIGTCP